MNMYQKFPRTYHLPWSPGLGSDDKIIQSLEQFNGQDIICTEKMDGENTTFYRSGMHARSLDSQHNFTRDWCKKLQSIISNDIPDGWRLCGENLSYYHSIEYDNLEGYFYLLSIWNDQNICLSWDDTKLWAEILDLPLPKVLYDGIFDLNHIKEMENKIDYSISEGYVIRIKNSFGYNDYSKYVVKYVRENHIQNASKFWLKDTFPNKLKDGICRPQFMK